MVAMLVGLHLSGQRHNFAKRADKKQMGLVPQGMIIGKGRVADSFWTVPNYWSNRTWDLRALVRHTLQCLGSQ